MTTAELLAQLLLRGGTIARARDCTEEEVSAAMADRRFASDEAGNAFVLCPAGGKDDTGFTVSALHMPKT